MIVCVYIILSVFFKYKVSLFFYPAKWFRIFLLKLLPLLFRPNTKLNEYLDLDLTIIKNTDFMCDRSMDGTEFTKLTNIPIPSWDDMLAEFATDQDFYNFN